MTNFLELLKAHRVYCAPGVNPAGPLHPARVNQWLGVAAAVPDVLGVVGAVGVCLPFEAFGVRRIVPSYKNPIHVPVLGSYETAWTWLH